MRERIGVIIPCRNVSSTIGSLLQSLAPDLLEKIDEILCIDNHSKDDTFAKLISYQSDKNVPCSHKLTLIKNSRDYNYGGSIKIGFRYFIDSGFDWIIIIHSDEQGESNTILRNFFIERSNNPDCDIILASRFKQESNTEAYSRSRLFGNFVFNSLTTLTTGLQISDSGTAIIMIKTALLKEVPYFDLTNGLQFHPQLNILVYSYPGVKIREVPLHWKDSDLPSSVRVLKYCLQLLLMLLCYRINLRIGKKGSFLFPLRDTEYHPNFQIVKSGTHFANSHDR
jgi:glycosyltransferase involved in cell wall biosynthesis